MEEYIKNNRLTLLIVFSSVLVGVCLGTIGVLRLDSTAATALYSGINNSVSTTGVFAAFLKSIYNEFKKFGIIFLCGITVIGSPVCVFYLGLCGYSIGFSAGFLMKYYGLSGFLATLAGIFPHYIILLPVYICAGIIGINFSNRLLRGERHLRNDFAVYLAKMIILAVFLLIACLVEGFISTLLLKNIIKIVT